MNTVIRNDSSTPTVRLFTTGAATKKSGGAVADTGEAPASSTQVSLSGASLAALAASANADEPVFDANKVEQIKSAIANGQFQIDPAKIADGLLQTVKNLLGPGAE